MKTVPLRHAQIIIASQAAVNLGIIVAAMRKQARVANARIADLNERLRIYNETAEFLMEKADGATLHELNKRLDFWRVIRQQPVVAEDEN